MAKKISLNSAYGAIGNQYFRYYKLANAEAITLSGQVSIRWIEQKMNKKYLNNLLKTEDEDYVIASDTDSIYLNMGSVVDKFFANRSGDKAKLWSYLIWFVVTNWNRTSTNVIATLDVCIGV